MTPTETILYVMVAVSCGVWLYAQGQYRRDLKEHTARAQSKGYHTRARLGLSRERVSHPPQWPTRYEMIKEALIDAQVANGSYPREGLIDSVTKGVDEFMTGKVLWVWSPEREQIEEYPNDD